MSEIAAKIQNLLDLARNNPSEEEAASAASMAQRLMLKHNITERDLGHVSAVIYSPGQPLDRDYFKILGHAVNAMTGCVMVLYGTDTYKLAGTKTNTLVAEQLLRFLAEQVEQLYKIYLPTGMSKRERAKYRKDFKRNCANRIYHRCLEHVKQLKYAKTTETTALVVVQDELQKEVDDFLRSKGVRTKSNRMQLNTNSRGGIDGQLAGTQAALQPRVKA